jgi:hypothetical protein
MEPSLAGNGPDDQYRPGQEPGLQTSVVEDEQCFA